MGLKTVREICMRMPLIMSEEVLLVTSLLFNPYMHSVMMANRNLKPKTPPPPPPPHFSLLLSLAVSLPCSTRHTHPCCSKAVVTFKTPVAGLHVTTPHCKQWCC